MTNLNSRACSPAKANVEAASKPAPPIRVLNRKRPMALPPMQSERLMLCAQSAQGQLAQGRCEAARSQLLAVRPEVANFCCNARARFWHISSVRCGAAIQRHLKVERTGPGTEVTRLKVSDALCRAAICMGLVRHKNATPQFEHCPKSTF